MNRSKRSALHSCSRSRRPSATRGSPTPGHMISIFFVSLIRVAAGRRLARSLQKHTMKPGDAEDKVLLESSNCMSHPAKPGVYQGQL